MINKTLIFLLITVVVEMNARYALAQIVPDFLSHDNFLPYMTEEKKQQEIIKEYDDNIRKKYPQTSEELYPHLYKYTHRDYLGPIRGTPADPANAFPNYSNNSFQKPMTNAVVSQSLYNTQLSIEQRNRAEVEADMAAYEARKIESQRLVNEAMKELERPTIRYNLGVNNSDAANRFAKAYSELNDMLSGIQKIDFLRAVWLVESSLDTSLSWEEFNSMFQDDVQIISQIMVKDKLDRNDNLAKLMAIYKFMADTTTVYIKSKEKNITTTPMLYDYEDYGGKKDITKVFVSKLLRTGTGQCMSLPMLYYLYAKAFGADANIAFAPEHTYITFKDHLNNWQDIELTGRIFTTNDFYWLSGFIKSEQLKSGIYLRPISEKETIAYLLTTLAITYARTFGTDDRLLEMALTARQYSPKSLTANMLLTGYSRDLWNNVLRQYEVYRLNDIHLAQDEKAQAVKKQKEASYDYLLKNLGYAKIPDKAYKQWLDGVNELANKKQHIVKRRQLEHQLNK